MSFVCAQRLGVPERRLALASGEPDVRTVCAAASAALRAELPALRSKSRVAPARCDHPRSRPSARRRATPGSTQRRAARQARHASPARRGREQPRGAPGKSARRHRGRRRRSAGHARKARASGRRSRATIHRFTSSIPAQSITSRPRTLGFRPPLSALCSRACSLCFLLYTVFSEIDISLATSLGVRRSR